MLHRICKIKETGQFRGITVKGNYIEYDTDTEIITQLVYDTDTKIVYYKFEDAMFNERNIGFMSPYLGLHGRPCRFIDCEIVEIPKDE